MVRIAPAEQRMIYFLMLMKVSVMYPATGWNKNSTRLMIDVYKRQAYNHSLSAVLNREMVAVEVLQSVAGSIGILCAVPCTAAVTCALHKLRLRKRAAAGAKAK